MDHIKKQKLLHSIAKVYDESEGGKLEDELFTHLEPYLKNLSAYFKVTKTQAFFLANFITLNYSGESAEIKELAEHFGCNPMEVLQFNDDFETLYNKGILCKHRATRHYGGTVHYDQFVVHEKVTAAILHNLPMPDLQSNNFDNLVEVLEKLADLGRRREKDEFPTRVLVEQAKIIMESNRKFTLLDKVLGMNLKTIDAYLFLFIVYRTITGDEKTDLSQAIDCIFDNLRLRIEYKQAFINSENDLVKKNLVEIELAEFFDDSMIQLTDGSFNLLQQEGFKLFANRRKKGSILEPANITYKELFFNAEESKQIEMLRNILSDKKLKEIQSKLKDKNLPKGITVLLYGKPGTGKTESVYQLARESNREVIQVDVSLLKSMWYGESQKLVRSLFADYRNNIRFAEQQAILLFNEADAIISRRLENQVSNTSQTENAIQNIILEELEKFEGIFFATTNMVGNLDTAFERRFLFKIELNPPEIHVKAKIWKSKLSSLSLPQCQDLAAQFDFSGGQIDNITRKVVLGEILNGNTVSIKEIINFCSNEKISYNNRASVGFRNN